ncbi:MAG: OmpA family protein, partial [Chitinophagales bacterium]
MRKLLFPLLLFILALRLQAQDKAITIYFPFNDNQPILSERIRLLYFLADSLDKSTAYKVEIRGFCDFIDSEAYNNILSQERADNIKTIITSNGISESSITLCQGFGEKSANPEKATEAERQLQRRVELRFICDCKNPEMQRAALTDITTPDNTPANYFVENEIFIDQYKAGDKFSLGNLNFYGGRHKLLPASIPALNNLLQVLTDNPKLKILIIGHICCEAPDVPDGYDYDTKTYNLSFNRAKEIYTYLIINGIDANRLQYTGAGPSQK